MEFFYKAMIKEAKKIPEILKEHFDKGYLQEWLKTRDRRENRIALI
jgi:hypothetical protein